ncbi:MAG TPA: alpha/beta fold hydrolase, partial [Vicinamibacteria bacterium]
MATTDQPTPPFRAARWGQRTLLGLGALGVGASVLGVAGSATVAHILTRPRRLRAVAVREIDEGVEEVTFRTDDGLTLRGWYLPSQAPRDAIVICHGFAMNRHELLDLARALRERGHAVLLFDFRAHGASEGARSTIGYREADDIRAAVAHLCDRPELAGRRIGAAGISMGAAAALLAAAREPAIAAVVADSSFATLRGIAADGLRALARRPVRYVPTPKLPAVLAPRLRALARLPALYAPLVVRFGELLT